MLQHPPERARPAVCCIDVSRHNNKESNSSIPAPHSSARRAGEKRKNLCCFCPFSGAVLPPPIWEYPPRNQNGRSFYGFWSTWLEFPSGFFQRLQEALCVVRGSRRRWWHINPCVCFRIAMFALALERCCCWAEKKFQIFLFLDWCFFYGREPDCGQWKAIGCVM